MQDHCCCVQSTEVPKSDDSTADNGVRIYLYASQKTVPKTGSWSENATLNRKHVFKMEMNPKNRFEIIAVEHCRESEDVLRHREVNRKKTGSLPCYLPYDLRVMRNACLCACLCAVQTAGAPT